MRAVGITGHQKAPTRVWEMLAARLPEVLGAPPFLGVTSLAAGADQEFADEVLRLGGSLFAVIPTRDYETTFTSLTTLHRYESLLDRSARVEFMDFPEPSEEAYLAAGRRVVDLSDVVVAVWDGLPAKGKGGTADVVEYADQRRKPVVRIWPEGEHR